MKNQRAILTGTPSPAPVKRRLSETRNGISHKFNIAGHEGYLNVGLFEDGRPGELFINMPKEGSTIGGLLDTIATFTTVALQYGIPLKVLVQKFRDIRFEPSGQTTNHDIPIASSVVDYVFHWMGRRFIPDFRDSDQRLTGEVFASDLVE